MTEIYDRETDVIPLERKRTLGELVQDLRKACDELAALTAGPPLPPGVLDPRD